MAWVDIKKKWHGLIKIESYLNYAYLRGRHAIRILIERCKMPKKYYFNFRVHYAKKTWLNGVNCQLWLSISFSNCKCLILFYLIFYLKVIIKIKI